MRALVIDDNSRAEIRRVLDHARNHRFTKADLCRLMEGMDDPPGDNPNFLADIPMGYKVVYTEEEQPFGWCRHISISVNSLTGMPHPEAVNMICQEFGFTKPWAEGEAVWMEHENDPRLPTAVNIIHKI